MLLLVALFLVLLVAGLIAYDAPGEAGQQVRNFFDQVAKKRLWK